MLRKAECSSQALDVPVSQAQRIRLLLREGVIAAQMLVLVSWLLIHVVLYERATSVAAWGPLLVSAALALLQTYAQSDRIWRFSGLAFVLVVMVGFKLLFTEYPLLHQRFSLPLTVLAVVGASLLIRGSWDYLVVAVLTWVLIQPYVNGESDDRYFLGLFVVFSFSLGWINSRTYIRALENTLDIERYYRNLSETDHLTALYNRRALMERLETFVATRAGGFFMMIDVDDFKSVNDRFGHGIGDEVLRVLAERLKAMAVGHCVGRLGGEEFGVILDTCDARKAYALAQQMLDAVRECREAPVPFTFSAGLAPFAPGQDISEILIHADRNLYKAKRAGKDRVHPGTQDSHSRQ
ncbi:GGDEF domain-containing protein [Pseudomonas sp. GD04058]|uniref:GGDEF domain-containing protein n=1 Tax=Pseudomonas sp. GD04058 TaxID=2975429 RepID=UPI00244894F3|nr:GGDEF domain-containing protein [Pseudomonas sp. GD04058]MDG9885138.1 GGDEF domain-containing protein [Pseudomonas sp. GD04058]